MFPYFHSGYLRSVIGQGLVNAGQGRPALHISVSYGKVRLFEVDFYYARRKANFSFF